MGWMSSLPCLPEPGRAPPQVWRGRQSVPVSGCALCLSANSWAPLYPPWPSASARVRPAGGRDGPSTPHPASHIGRSRQTRLPGAPSGLTGKHTEKKKKKVTYMCVRAEKRESSRSRCWNGVPKDTSLKETLEDRRSSPLQVWMPLTLGEPAEPLIWGAPGRKTHIQLSTRQSHVFKAQIKVCNSF